MISMQRFPAGVRLINNPAATHFSRSGFRPTEKRRRCPGDAEQEAALHRVSQVGSVQLARGDACIVTGFEGPLEGHVRQGARQNEALLKMGVSGDDVVMDKACSISWG